MCNTIYKRVYDAFFTLYDTDPPMGQNDIVKALMDGPDRVTAQMTAELTQERYQLTVKNFAASMTATSTKLVKNVPKAILVYQSKRLVEQNRALMDSLKANPGEAAQILSQIQDISRLRKAIDERLGRVQ